MADSLDDFFAKKDKKRGKDKNKSSALSAEALVRELEEGSKQTDYPTRKDNKTSTAVEILGLDADDADWKDFEEVERRDYTGLKVKEMSLQDQNEEEQRRLLAEQSEPVADSTAWKMKDETPAATAAELNSSNANKQKAENTNDQTAESDTKTVSGSNSVEAKTASTQESGSDASKKDIKQRAKFVPPQERNNQVRLLEPTRLGRGKASTIDFKDEEAFPSLG